MHSIPYGRQNITQEDVDTVIAALQSDFLTQGPQITTFEAAFAEYVGAKYAVAVSNGTAALHLCALALDVDRRTNVITTPITFAASANCIRYCGGNVKFVDIDPLSILLDLNQVEDTLKKSRKRYHGIVPVDFAGQPIHLEEVRQIANKYGLWIIEDACHAPGGHFTDSKGVAQKCGNGTYADLAIFSFHPVKHIATGEGGMVTTNNEKLYAKLLKLRTHGISKDTTTFANSMDFAASKPNQTNYPGWYMEMQDLGYNYRLTDFQAALGISQLKRADAGLSRRRAIAASYDAAFATNPSVKWQSSVVEGHAYHLYVIQVADRLGLYNHLRTHNIFAQIHYIPCHLMPYYKQFGWKEGDLPHAEKYYQGCISLPIYPTLTDAEQQYVINTITAFLK